jgi:hypothetical protein
MGIIQPLIVIRKLIQYRGFIAGAYIEKFGFKGDSV